MTVAEHELKRHETLVEDLNGKKKDGMWYDSYYVLVLLFNSMGKEVFQAGI